MGAGTWGRLWRVCVGCAAALLLLSLFVHCALSCFCPESTRLIRRARVPGFLAEVDTDIQVRMLKAMQAGYSSLVPYCQRALGAVKSYY